MCVCVTELMFLETSALTGENVEEAFVQCARKILNKIESGRNRGFTPASPTPQTPNPLLSPQDQRAGLRSDYRSVTVPGENVKQLWTR